MNLTWALRNELRWDAVLKVGAVFPIARTRNMRGLTEETDVILLAVKYIRETTIFSTRKFWWQEARGYNL